MNKNKQIHNYIYKILIFILIVSFIFPFLSSNLFPFSEFNKYKWISFIFLFGYSFFIYKKINSFSVISIYFFIFILIATTSTLLNTFSFEGISRAISFIILFLLSFCFIIPADPDLRITIWNKYIFLILAIIIILSIFYKNIIFGRMFGITNHPNTLGFFSVITLVGSFALLSQKKNLKFTILYIFIFLASAYILFLSQSRTALISGIAGIGAILSLWRTYYFIIPLCISIYLITINLQNSILNNIYSLIFLRKINFNHRIYIWKEQLQGWYENIFFGVGLVPKQHGTNSLNIFRVKAEGSYPDMLSISGILGTIAYITGIIACTILFYKLCMLRHKLKIENKYLIFSFGIYISIIVASIGECYLTQVGSLPSIYFWIISGTIIQYYKYYKKDM